MTIPTMNKINAAIKETGFELFKGNGYFYFMDVTEDFSAGDTPPSVYTMRLRDLSLEAWIEVATESEDVPEGY